ncbi:deoxyribose-phosphate aldolase [Ammonifex thiophilus]|uniref:Deoxyribose-phosphate aldolase n=1 Tax=Ammonifex thiophilus TaxID=444093 RepID=A0A3D8P6R1_9THEO|nr:deoxyribose-phosphate aldolase [Ammonifex thiophilus]RDV84010.1 deoxyribose-phosphate aldolase [Ammonifex thiophilus]
MDLRELARRIDHTLLRPEAGEEDIKRLCAEALRYGFFAVCVNPVYVPLAVETLRGSPVKVCTVVGFPLGANSVVTKVVEARQAAREGAEEFDLVLNLGALKDRRFSYLREELKAVRETVKEICPQGVLKVILETSLLTREEKLKGCELVLEVGAEFVKTSTGFGPGGATVEDVKLLRQAVGDRAGVKAAGGIKTLKDLLSMLEAGADRIGSSSAAKIMRELQQG